MKKSKIGLKKWVAKGQIGKRKFKFKQTKNKKQWKI